MRLSAVEFFDIVTDFVHLYVNQIDSKKRQKEKDIYIERRRKRERRRQRGRERNREIKRNKETKKERARETKR